MAKPLPCPFCGFPPAVEMVSYGAIVACSNVGCEPHPRVLLLDKPMTDAIERWNIRFDPNEQGCCSCKHAIGRHSSLGCVDCDCDLRG